MKKIFNAKGKKRRSLVRFCIFNFIFYSAIVLLLYLTLNYLVIQKLNREFPTIENVLACSEQLENDDFESIPKSEYENCGFLVFDGERQLLFSTDESLEESVTGEDIWLINSYDSRTHYQVSKVYLDDDSQGYFVTLCYRDPESGEELLLGFSLLDSNYNITSGDLFESGGKLSSKEFEFINGNYNDKKLVVKHEYLNSGEEFRTLVFVSDLFTEQAYEKALGEANYIWLIAFPILGICIAVQVLLLRRDIKRSITPIDKAISAYKDKKTPELDPEDIPAEFRNTASGFLEMHNKLEKEKAEKEEAYREIKRLMTDISHDLKTPITVIQGYAQAFANDKIPRSQREKYAELIYSKSKSTAKLIDALFEYIQMEHPQYTVSLQTLDICEFTREYLADRYQEIENRGFILEPEIPEEVFLCGIDEALFGRVYDNLINNVLKYNPKGTRIYFALKKKDGRAVIQVGDSGKGIPTEIRGSIFSPYVTGDAARTAGGGTGLGMSIARKIVLLHGGTIVLEDKCPKGISTLFTIELDIKEEPGGDLNQPG